MSKKTTTIAWAAFAAFAGFGLSDAFAQGNEVRLAGAQVIDKSAYTNLPCFIKLDQHITQENFVNWAVYAFNVPNNSTFKAYNVEKDKLGFTHTRHKQYINGIPVEGTQVISHCKDGKITIANGDYYQNFSSNLSASISEASALKSALNKVNAKKYMWEDQSMVKLMEESFLPKGELVMVHKKGADYSASNMRLAYKFNIYAQIPLYRANVFVDANTGEILDEQNLICTATVVGSADTKYSGTVSMSCDNNAGTYRLRETGRGNGINTYNMNNTSTYSSTDFTNASSNWTSTGNDQAATDAHWGAEMTYDYYWQTHTRNSINNAGYALNSYVHYNTPSGSSTGYVNAFWDGTRMSYGDGDLSQDFDIMTALDVCGHEITHGLTSNTAALGSGEAGALNEAFSDIFGTTIERFARPAQWDWIMGADIMPSHKGIRDMSQPKNIGQPNTYMGVNWDPAGEVHQNNGPCIYWYYLLCQGGSGTNDNNNVYNVSAITMDEAQFIAFRGLTVYFTSGTTYANARQYTIQAATDLYGACSKEVASTTNAWYAVGVGAASTVSWPSASFSSASTLQSCSPPLTVNFSNSSTGATTYSWTFGDGGTSTTASPAHTYTAGGIYAVQMVATGSCSASAKDTMKKVSYITVNGPPTAVSPAPSCVASTHSLTANGVGSITWSNASGTVAVGSNYVTPTITTTTSYSVTSSIMTAGSATLTGAPTNTNTIGAGSYLAISNNHYLVFDALVGFTLKTVDAYVQTAGTTLTVQVLDNAGVVLATASPTVVVGKNVISLNVHIPPGTGYKLTAGGTATLFRNNAGASYPIAVGTAASITGNDVMATAPTYYYWFYNWIYAKDIPCNSSPTVVTVSVSASPTVTATSATVCAGTNANLTANGATTYTWNPGGLTGATVTVTPSSTTAYTVTGATAGCSSVANGIVTVNASPTVTASAASICTGASANLSANGATSYTWNPGGLTGPTVTVTPSSTTSYTVTGTSAGCTNSTNAVVTVNATPTVTTASGTVCAGSSANLNAGGATTYTWNPGGLTGASVVVSPSVTTTYSVTGANGNCTNAANAVVTVNTLPTIGVSALQDSLCTGGSTGINATGGVTYNWSPSSSLSSSTGANVTASPTVTTVYNVSGTDANGCMSTASQTIVVNGCAGINNNGGIAVIAVYPNPAHDNLVVSAPHLIKSITVVDMIGKTLLNLQPENETKVSMDVSSFPAGVYFVKVNTGDTQKLIRVIKQ
jgi:Zn-dependent metalloprotease